MALSAYEEVVSEAPLIADLPAPGAVVATRVLEDIGITEWTLANGVRVAVVPTDYKDDEIIVRAVSPGGTSLVAGVQVYFWSEITDDGEFRI